MLFLATGVGEAEINISDFLVFNYLKYFFGCRHAFFLKGL